MFKQVCKHGHNRVNNVDVAGNCKTCSKLRGSAHYRANRDEYISRASAWRTPERRRAQHLRRKYNVDEIWFQGKIEAQQQHCPICGTLFDLASWRGSNAAVIDHDHNTGLVRDVLCAACNKGLGHFRDDPAALERAAVYLRKHRA